jgi:hypothetical protein
MLEGRSNTVMLSAEDGTTQTLPFPTVAPVLGTPGTSVVVDSERRIALYDQAHARVVRRVDAGELSGVYPGAGDLGCRGPLRGLYACRPWGRALGRPGSLAAVHR